MQIIKLQSSDGGILEADIEVAKCSVTIKEMIEGLGLSEGEQDVVVPLPNVKLATLKKVFEFITYHKDDPTPEPEEEDEYEIYREKPSDDICQWDRDFLNVDREELFQLLLAANYLIIRGLVEVSCKTVANMIKGKSPNEIRKVFGKPPLANREQDGSADY